MGDGAWGKWHWERNCFHKWDRTSGFAFYNPMLQPVCTLAEPRLEKLSLTLPQTMSNETKSTKLCDFGFSGVLNAVQSVLCFAAFTQGLEVHFQLMSVGWLIKWQLILSYQALQSIPFVVFLMLGGIKGFHALKLRHILILKNHWQNTSQAEDQRCLASALCCLVLVMSTINCSISGQRQRRWEDFKPT